MSRNVGNKLPTMLPKIPEERRSQCIAVRNYSCLPTIRYAIYYNMEHNCNVISRPISKSKFSLSTPWGHVGSRGIAPFIHYLFARWRWVVYINPTALLPWRGPRDPWNRRLGGPQKWSWRFGEDKKSRTPTGLRTRYRPARSVLAISTTLEVQCAFKRRVDGGTIRQQVCCWQTDTAAGFPLSLAVHVVQWFPNPKVSATSSQAIRGYSSLTETLKFTCFVY